MRELVIRKCEKCGALVKVINDCDCSSGKFSCCGEEMIKLIPNSSEADSKKHIPEVIIDNDRIQVCVNHVMEDEHYIEWVSLVSDDKEITRYFKPGEKANIDFSYNGSCSIYAYCNKHGLWKKDI